jgi:hypothetical protein
MKRMTGGLSFGHSNPSFETMVANSLRTLRILVFGTADFWHLLIDFGVVNILCC